MNQLLRWIGEQFPGLLVGATLGALVAAILDKPADARRDQLVADGAQCAEDFDTVSVTLAHCWHDLRVERAIRGRR
jgi:hypothetical protein